MRIAEIPCAEQCHGATSRHPRAQDLPPIPKSIASGRKNELRGVKRPAKKKGKKESGVSRVRLCLDLNIRKKSGMSRVRLCLDLNIRKKRLSLIIQVVHGGENDKAESSTDNKTQK